MTAQHQIVGRFVFDDASKACGNRPQAAVAPQSARLNAGLIAAVLAIVAVAAAFRLFGL
jgi:hypothetical protein